MDCFENVKKNFGFGCMRLPMKDEKVDLAEFSTMVDRFIESGFNYFDTAAVYIGGQSETAIRECISKRYPRDSFILANKLSTPLFSCEADILPAFEKQLTACGVEYFDFYLMHAQNRSQFEKYKRCRAYETAFELKRQGKVHHVGLSFHDTADVLEVILNEYPDVEFVQLQFNYVDYDDPAVQAGACYEVCRKHGKPIIVMEPVKGGNLANLPEDARTVIDALGGGSAASYAMRYAAGFDGIMMVLSGMSNIEQMNDNLSCMIEFRPLDENERQAVDRVREIFLSKKLIPCTDCRYCTAGCPKQILIPSIFSCLNAKRTYHNWNSDYYYNEVYTKSNGKASDCIACGKCEMSCPQHLPIINLLKEAVEEFEKK